ncbi:MAG TPA: TetR/AcrR family transcriptional regulator [Solirubrobacteraceae bacterium]|jgi:AcrR family transcriptional regulator
MPPEERRQQLLDAALGVILEQGYAGVSIEAIARTAGVTRPVVYDHFPNLGMLLASLFEREEQSALAQLAEIFPGDPGAEDPAEVLARGVGRFLEAVASRPATWRLILLPPEGTPELVRRHVEANRTHTLAQIEQVVRWALAQPGWPSEVDPELAARAIRAIGEEAGRTLLIDPERYSPERYEQFVVSIMRLLGGHPG